MLRLAPGEEAAPALQRVDLLDGMTQEELRDYIKKLKKTNHKMRVRTAAVRTIRRYTLLFLASDFQTRAVTFSAL